LIHADLLHGNALVDDPAELSIIDWGSSFYGDPVYEYASLSYWTNEVERRRPIHLRSLAAALESIVLSDEDTAWRFALYKLHVALQQLRFNSSRSRFGAMQHHANRVDRLASSLEDRLT
jgi:aminoglycoside phosphotransferase (APT) family kinase protein